MPERKKDDDRKAGLPALNLRSAGAYGGAMPGAPAAGAGAGAGLLGLGTLGGKIALVLVLTTLGAGAFGVVRMLAPSQEGSMRSWRVGAARPSDQPAVSAQPAAPSAQAESSGLGMVSGSLDDRTAAQKAADAAAAKAAADAAAASKADASANATPAAVAGSLTAQAGGPKASPFATKFGALSQGTAGGGQIGAALNGGSGLSGGIGLGFDHALGAPKGFSSSRGTPAAQSALMARSGTRGRGIAYRQLTRANGLSHQAAASSGETSNALASEAFNNHPVGAGSPITGGGAMGATTGAGTTAGGPLNGPTNGVQMQNTQAAQTASHKDSTPWGAQAKLATMLLVIAGIALLAAQLLAAMARKAWIAASWAMPLAQMLAVVAAGLGAAAAALGILMMKQGQMMYGAIFTGGGALISILSVKALLDDTFNANTAVHNAGTTATDKAADALGGKVSPAGSSSAPQQVINNGGTVNIYNGK